MMRKSGYWEDSFTRDATISAAWSLDTRHVAGLEAVARPARQSAPSARRSIQCDEDLESPGGRRESAQQSVGEAKRFTKGFEVNARPTDERRIVDVQHSNEDFLSQRHDSSHFETQHT
jgi:hypothetical protein